MKNIYIVSLIFLFTACKKFVEPTSPVGKIDAREVFASNGTAIAAVSNLYADLRGALDGNISIHTGLSSDELILTGADLSNESFYKNALRSTEANGEYWERFYKIIYSANDAIESLNSAEKLSPIVKKQLLGEAKLMRGLSHFYLFNFFGPIPLLVSTDYRINRLATKASKVQIFSQIILDLKDASELLSEDYLDADLTNISTERVRPNKATSHALLAKVYLYNNDFVNAESEATLVLNDVKYKLEQLTDVFKITSKEAIFQLKSYENDYRNTLESRALAAFEDNLPKYFASDFLINSFDLRDQRLTTWFGIFNVPNSGSQTEYRYINKYKLYEPQAESMENFTVFRLAEMYLIRAESRIMLNKIAEGVEDINILRRRATDLNLPLIERLPLLGTTISQSAAVYAVESERNFELFCELGNRWFDIRRTGRINEVMENAAIEKGTAWNPSWALYPIPLHEIQNAPGLAGKQNNDY